VTKTIQLVARLAQIMAEEVDLLSKMKVGDIAPLQMEKFKLVEALNEQKNRLAANPAFIGSISAQEREDLRKMMEIFENISQENYRKLLMARSVNERVVEAIHQAVKEEMSTGLYTDAGNSHISRNDPIPSVTLNRTV
jgi:flagellar biosynthesis/type III secretory pathway chaperone